MSKLPEPAKFIREHIVSPVREFIHDSRAVGIVLICCTVISMGLSNSTWGQQYTDFWQTTLQVALPEIHLPHSVLHIINDFLMAVFFLLAGLEIKRELIVGELAGFKKAMLPVIAALGGMVVPACIYYIWCGSTPFSNGWGIPMATDIAFSLGVLSLLGKRAPLSLRIFLMALAIIDDLGGILAIAVFYAGELSVNYLLGAAGVFLLLVLMNLFKVKRYYLYFIPGIVLWYFVYNSGIHATVAGVLLAFTIPLGKIKELEHNLHDPVSFIILPLFALANTAIILPQDIGFIFSSVVHHGIFMGLVLGKPLGIFCFSFIAVKLGIGSLPRTLSWKHIWGMGMIAGIGFTISIFMATLAFADVRTQVIAKVAIMGASVIAGVCGFLYLKTLGRKKELQK